MGQNGMRFSLGLGSRLRASSAYVVFGCAGLCTACVAIADPVAPTSPAALRPTLNFNGVPGLIDMPTAEAMPDGELAASVSTFGGFTRGTLSWQLSPRLSASFRYSLYEGLNRSGYLDYYDRSFDVRYQLAWEGKYTPALAVGLQDFAGTGLYSGEYVVATKTVHPTVKLSAGVGWGRYGSYNSIASPFGSERTGSGGTFGGELAYDTWFRGPMSAFGGVEWRPTDKLGVKLEYSSDAYEFEAGTRGLFERKTPFNFGVEYQVSEGVRLGAYSLYGSEVGVSASFAFNPVRAATPRSDPAPGPIAPRPERASNPQLYSAAWVAEPEQRETVRSRLAAALKAEGQTVVGQSYSGSAVHVWVENNRHNAPAGAVGRIGRVMAATLPASVEEFHIVLTRGGVSQSTVTLQRRDLEVLEASADRADALWARTQVAPGKALPVGARTPELFPRYSWRLAPYTQTSYFDPENPVLIQYGLRASGSVEFLPGLSLSGSVTQSLGGTLEKARISTSSGLETVRTDWPLYYRDDSPVLETMTLAYATNLGSDFYGRVTAGHLERMYSGVSAELLWKPVDSRLALGAEVNHVIKREPGSAFGLGDYSTTMGHVSAYYEMENGYMGQVDVGRYLAGDVGATFSLSREFANGWSVSGFATFTNVSAEEFGEGSFDKGVRFKIPLTWGIGQPTRRSLGHTIRPVQRDGGAKVSVPGRLYGKIRDGHKERISDGWPLVWR